MKKLITLTLILFLILGIFSNVYASSSYSIILETATNEISVDEEFIVNVKIANIVDNNGIIVVGGKINYDKDALTLVRLEAENDFWNKPTYYSETGIFVLDREDYGKTDEILFKMVFKINNKNVINSKIYLTALSATNGEYDIPTEDAEIFVSTTTTSEPTPPGTVTPTESPKPSTEPTKKPGIISNLLPKTGTNSNPALLIFLLILLSIIAAICYRSIKKINKENRDENTKN